MANPTSVRWRKHDVSNATVWERRQFEKINFSPIPNPSPCGICVGDRQLRLTGILGRLNSEFLQRPIPSQTRLLGVCYDLWQHQVLRSWDVCCVPGIMNLVLGIDLLYSFIHSFTHWFTGFGEVLCQFGVLHSLFRKLIKWDSWGNSSARSPWRFYTLPAQQRQLRPQQPRELLAVPPGTAAELRLSRTQNKSRVLFLWTLTHKKKGIWYQT